MVILHSDESSHDTKACCSDQKLKPKTDGSSLYNLQCGTNEANRISRVGDNPYVLKFSSSKGLNNDPYDQHFTFTLGLCRLKKES